MVLSTTYNPPFVYSYQCVSSVLTTYVPIYIEIYAATAVLYPLFIMALVHVCNQVDKWKAAERAQSGDGSEGQSVSSNLLTFSSGVVRSVFESISTMSAVPPIVRGATIVRTLSAPEPGSASAPAMKLFDPGLIIAHLVNHLLVLLTFGVAFPMLGMIIALSVCSITLTWQVIIHRPSRQ